MWHVHVWKWHVTHINVASFRHFTHLHVGHRHTHINVARHTCECGMSRKWIRHIAHLQERYVTHMNESRHTHEWVTSHTWMSHVTHMNESRHTQTKALVWSACMRMTWLCRVCDVSHVYVWNAHIECLSHATVYKLSSCHTWRSHVTHTNESCHSHEGAMSHTRRSHVTRMKESCVTQAMACLVAHDDTRRSWACTSHVSHTNESCHTHRWVISHAWKSHITHTKESFYTHDGVMSTRRWWRVWWRTTLSADRGHAGVMSHTWWSHAACMKESCHAHKEVVLYAWRSGVYMYIYTYTHT